MNLNSVRKLRAALALFLGAALTCLAVGQTTTTDATSGNDKTVQMQKFVVTGTNIPTAADALAIPVTVLGPQQIQASGVETNTLDILRKMMPMFAGNGNIGGENATINSNFTFGGSSLSLHNLSTLVLINGRRMPFDPAEAEGGAEYVDLNMIPASAIDRIEVLNDGASAIYGSDAVGGVVNVILKSNYNGWEANYHFGESPNTGHYKERTASITGGVSNGTTSITLSAEYSKQDPIYMWTRPYTNPIYGSTLYPGIIDIYDLSTGNDLLYKLNPSMNAPPGGGKYTIDQLVQMGVYTPQTHTQVLDGFNLANYQTLEESSKRRSLLVNLTHKIVPGTLEGFGDVLYSNTNTMSSLNGQPIYDTMSDPYLDVYAQYGVTPPPPGNPYMLTSNPNSPFSATWMDQGAPADGSAGFAVSARDRFFTTPRLSLQDSTVLRAVGGLRGNIGENYNWEAAANLGRYTLDFTNPGVVNTNNFNAAVAAGQINPFSYSQSAPPGVIGTAFVNMVSALNSFDFKFTGKPIDLPAGKLGFAVGASFARETLSAVPDVNSIPDANGNIGWLYGVSMQPFSAHRDVTSGFAEIEAPIFAPNQNIPGLHSLNVDLAGRIDNYTQVGTSSVPKVSIKYQPIDDQLTLRASAGKSFSAPILYDLYGPITTGSTVALSFNNYNSAGQPTGQQTNQVQYNAVTGANKDLKPSTSTTWTAGFVYSPKAVKGLSLTVDYYHTIQKNLVGNYDPTVVVQSVEQYGTTSPYASVVHFGSRNGTPVTAPGQISTHPQQSVYLNLPLVNLAAQEIKGWDATLEYAFDVPNKGHFDFQSTWSGYNSYRAQALPSDPYYQFAGHASGNGSVSQGTIPRWRAYSTLRWQDQGFGLMIGHTYIPAVTDIGPGGSAATAPGAVGSYQQFDLIASYDFSHLSLNQWLDKLSVSVGVNNMFNRLPPLAPNAFPDTNADVGTYLGGIGRMYFVDATYKF
jgi:iron complex outermembrane recepter protein